MNICIFGDSITWGAYDPKNGGWVNLLKNYFESEDSPPYFREAGDALVYNLGVCGDTSADLLVRMETEAKSRNPDLIIIAIGINDAKFVISENKIRTSIEEFEKNLQQILLISKKFTSKIIFVGPTRVDESKTNSTPWEPDNSYLNKNIENHDKIIQKFCEKNNIKYIFMGNLLEKSDIFDGLHPKTKGHKKIFNLVKPEIESFLRQAK